MKATDDDLEARLVLGDELVAKGDPRGELIVAQCEIERGRGDRTRSIALRKRVIELLREARAGLEGTPLAGKFIDYRRGAIDKLTIVASDFVRDQEEIWRLAPELRRVDLCGVGYESPEPGGSDDPNEWHHVRDAIAPALGRIVSLGLSDAEIRYENLYGPDEYGFDFTLESAADRVAEWLVETNAVAKLEGLALRTVVPSTLKLLATSSATAHLDEIELSCGKPCDDSTFEALERTKLAPRRIKIEFDRYDPFDARLIGTPFMRRVTDLTVPFFENFTVGPQLRRLALPTRNGPEFLERLASAPELAGLEELVLTDAHDWIGSLDLRPLYEPKRLDSLRELHVYKGANVEAMRELLRSPLGRRLEAVHHFWFDHGPTLAEVTDWDGVVFSYPRRGPR